MLRRLATAVLFCSAMFSALCADAQLPATISFQGVLADAAGAPVIDGLHTLRLRIYDAPTGGTELFAETANVNVLKGVFDVMLGAASGGLPNTLQFDRQYFLSITVDGGAELSPRTPMSSVPYAFRAHSSERASTASRADTALHAATADALSDSATGVVTSVNASGGAITIVGGGATTVSRDGSTITISSASGSGATGIQGVQNTDGSLAITESNGPVASLRIADGGIRSAHIASSAVTLAKHANNSVNSSKIVDLSIAIADIGANQVDASKISTAGATTYGQALMFTPGNASPSWSNPTAADLILPFLRSQASGGYLFGLTNSSLGGAAQFIVANNTSTATALAVSTIGTGKALEVSGLVTQTNGSVLFSGRIGSTPASGPGARMMWIPRHNAFRAGYAEGTQWDDSLIGNTSVAFGVSTTARAHGATAVGMYTLASGGASFACGQSTVAAGDNSFAAGLGTTASGASTVALGSNASTNGKSGTFVYSDRSTGQMNASANNQFLVRAAGGTTFFSNAGMTSGVTLAAGGGAWTSVSDSAMKENFGRENGEMVLTKLRAVPVMSWNYKSQSASIRHIGPMAQDLYAAFGFGESDTTITTIDIDGINMLAVKALEQRTSELRDRLAEIDVLRAENRKLSERLESVERSLRLIGAEQR